MSGHLRVPHRIGWPSSLSPVFVLTTKNSGAMCPCWLLQTCGEGDVIDMVGRDLRLPQERGESADREKAAAGASTHCPRGIFVTLWGLFIF